jgi:flagellar basal-body rod modification protein FlgD
MTNVSPTASQDQLLASLNQASSQASTQASSTGDLQNRFLKLLVTQMQNQDPLNPMDNAQVTSQLAQISTVSGIDTLNSTVAGMASSFLAAQSLQASALIGHTVLAPGNDLTLQNAAAAGGVLLDQPADAVTVTVVGADGRTVKTINLGPQQAGAKTFAWDGSTDAGGNAPDGAYAFKVSAVQGGKQINVQALGYGLVQSVTLGSGQVQLNTIGLGTVNLGDVKQII